MNYLSRENVEEVLGLSPLQENLLSGEAEGPRPIIQAYRYLERPLDPQRLQAALDHVVASHPALRTIFRPLRGRLVQVVLRTRPVPLSTGPDLVPDTDPFDPAVGPLLRASRVGERGRDTGLALACHEAALDERSLVFVLGDLLDTEAALSRGEAPPRLDRRPFRDYLGWLGGQDWSPAKEFWASHLEGVSNPTPPPYDHRPSGGHAGPRRVSRAVGLPGNLPAALAGLAGRHGVSLEAVALAAWAIYLGLVNGEENVVFGLESQGRPLALAGAEEMLGRFDNTLPVRVAVSGHLALGDFLRDLERQRLSLARFAYTPLAEALSHGQAPPDFDLGSRVVVRPGQADTVRAQAGSAFSCTAALRTGPHPALELVYAPDLFEADTADQTLTSWLGLLAGLADRSDGRLGDLDLLPPAQRHRVLVEFNRTPAGGALDRLAHQVIEEQAASRPETVAAVSGQESVTYGELDRKAGHIALWLRSRGFGPDDLAALLATRGIGMLAAILGVAKAGGAYVPLDPAHPDPRLAGLLRQSRARVILTDATLAERSLRLGREAGDETAVLCLEPSDWPGLVDVRALAGLADVRALAGPAGTPRPLVNEPHDLANVFFTSGSTGVPKGAMIDHVGMLNHLRAKILTTRLSERSVVAQNASHCFDISVWQFLAPLMVGGKVVIYDDETAGDPVAFLAGLRRDRVTVAEVVPTMLELLLEAAERAGPEEGSLPDLEYLVSTAEALPVALARRWMARYPKARLINAYGATECSDDTTHEIVEGVPPDHPRMSVGLPIPNFRIYVLDSRLRPVPVGCRGEICFSGIGVGRGYLGDPVRTAEVFIPDPFSDTPGARLYRTGDVGRHLPDGRIVFLGRADFQVKVRGHRIELGEVEAALLGHGAVAQAVAIVRPDGRGQNRLLAYVVGQAIETAALRAHLETVLPDYMIPEHITPLPAFPLTRNGKVDRKALPDPGPGPTRAVVAPRDAVEAALVEIWREVLEVSVLGIEDNFFELGGHSLKTIQVRSRIKDRLRVDVGLRALFERQTIRELAPYVGGRLSAGGGGEEGTIPRLPAADHYPLSHAQKRLWFLQRLEPHNLSYNMLGALELQGPLDLRAVREALTGIAERHDSLRTTFTVIGGQPVQRVRPGRPDMAYTVDDLAGLPPEARDLARDRIQREFGETPLDLENGPLFRVRLLRLGDESHLVLLAMHHIISDAWSWQILGREFAALYQAAGKGEPVSLPSLAVGYVDYADWQSGRLESEASREDEGYWLGRLGGELPVLDLPTDRPRPPIQTFTGRAVSRRLPAEIAGGLTRLGAEREVTLFMLLLTAAGVFLGRMSGQDDIIVGTPAAGRGRVELEDIIGFFINTLALRLDLSGDPTFSDLVAEVKGWALDAYAHQEYPFDKLVERLNPARDLSRSPIFSVLFQVNRATVDVPLEGLRVRPREVRAETAMFDLTITVSESADGLDLRLEYNTDLWDGSTAERWLGHLETLLGAVVAQPDLRLSALPLLTATERERLLGAGRGELIPLPPVGVHDLVLAETGRGTEAAAVVAEDGRLTYAQLGRRVQDLALRLGDLGVKPGTAVGVYLGRSAALPVALLGALRAGGHYVPLDPVYPRERLAFMLADSGARVVITSADLARGLAQDKVWTGPVVLVDGEGGLAAPVSARAGAEAMAPPLPPSPPLSTAAPREGPAPALPSDLAYVIYTSGSTGRPKGIQVQHGSVVNFLRSMRRTPGLGQNDVLVAVTSISFDIAALEILLPLSVGATLVIAGRETVSDGARLARLLDEAGATVMQGTPATWRLLLEAGWRNDGRLRMLVGGEAWSPDLAGRLGEGGAELWNLYGPTETTIWSSLARVEAAGRTMAPGAVMAPGGAGRAIPLGQPIANTRFYVLDGRGQPVPAGVLGQLHIGGAGLARGYQGRPELTAEYFAPDPFGDEPGGRLYQTGDLVRRHPDDSLEFAGRADDQVKMRGFRIELGEIEAALSLHPAVRQAAVLAREDGPGERRLVAYVAPKPSGLSPSADELQDFLKLSLPEYMVPAIFVSLEALPLTPSGKIDRRALPSPEGGPRLARRSQVPPRDTAELAMTRIWERILGGEPLGVEDDFFAVGGHSLKAVALMAAVRDGFGVELPLAALFQAPTIARLVERVRTAVASPESGCLVKIQEGDGAEPPLFMVHPQGGGVLCYLALAREMGKGATVYGLQARGFDSDEEALSSVEAMARLYVAEIRRQVPAGPYRLAGWSFGGSIAFEMARLLEAVGEKVGFLGLIDAHPLGHPPGGSDRQAGSPPSLALLAAEQLKLDPELLAGLDEASALELILRRTKELGLLPPGATLATVRRQAQVRLGTQAAAEGYEYGGPIEADVRLFRATGGEPGQPAVAPAGWRDRTRGRVLVTDVPGTHHSLIDAPHVRVLASAIRAGLSEGGGRL